MAQSILQTSLFNYTKRRTRHIRCLNVARRTDSSSLSLSLALSFSPHNKPLYCSPHHETSKENNHNRHTERFLFSKIIKITKTIFIGIDRPFVSSPVSFSSTAAATKKNSDYFSLPTLFSIFFSASKMMHMSPLRSEMICATCCVFATTSML